jgi:hypothetical protein
VTSGPHERGGASAWEGASPSFVPSREIALVNVGDSIATGEWGIRCTDEHYVAVLARRIAARTGMPHREGLVRTAATASETTELYGTTGRALPFVDPRPAGCVTWFTSGIGATRTADLSDWLEREGGRGTAAYAALAPALLIVEIGVNDAIHADVEDLEVTARRYRLMLRGLIAAGLRVALVGAVPVRHDFQPGPWRVADAYERIYRPVATELGLPLLDALHRWGGYDLAHERGFVADQVHPTAAGHADLALALDRLLSAGATGRATGRLPAG